MLVLISVGFIGSAQKKETRQERIDRWKNDMAAFQARREQGLKAYDMADSIESRISQAAVMDASFVLEADAVTFKRGTRVQVNSATNFISVNDHDSFLLIFHSVRESLWQPPGTFPHPLSIYHITAFFTCIIGDLHL